MVTYALMMTGIVSVVFEADGAKFSVIQVSSGSVMPFPSMHLAASFSLEVHSICDCIPTLAYWPVMKYTVRFETKANASCLSSAMPASFYKG